MTFTNKGGPSAVMELQEDNIKEGDKDGVGEDEFSMWRAVFAMAHADHKVTIEEERFMYRIMDEVAFSEAQKNILRNGMKNPEDIAELFEKISRQKMRSRFFYYARMLLWCDGDFDEQEQQILTALGRSQYQGVDFDEMVKDDALGLSLEEEEQTWLYNDVTASDGRKDGLLQGFFNRFFS